MPPEILIDDLSFSYPGGTRALDSISLSIEPAERVALVGPNGAGKSTLLLQLNGLLRPAQGRVLIGGLAVEEPHLGTIRARVGMLFQNPDDQLFNPRVFDDVAFGPLHMGLPADEVRARADAALQAVGMAAYAGHISHHLSLGQKKRAAIASVLSMSPSLLALDEPTSGLDPRARRQLIDLLAGMSVTLLCATHDMRMAAELFERTVIMDGGRVVADGPSARLLADEALLAAHGLEHP